jgi:hypothetical protein
MAFAVQQIAQVSLHNESTQINALEGWNEM